MKKSLLVLSLLISFLGHSQLHTVGFHAGAMGTSLGSKFWDGDSKMKIDFTGGLNYQIRFSSHLTASASVEYTQFGAQIPVQFYNYAGTTLLGESYSSYDWNYISIPLTVGFQMGGRIRFKPKIGLVPSILARMVYNLKPYEGSTLTPLKTSYYSDANKFDLAAVAGIDISTPFKAGVIFLGLDFRFSVTKVNRQNMFPEEFYDPYRHRGAVAVFGVRFTLGKPEPEGPKDIIDDPIE